jgi:hypothetical protein
MPDDDLTLAWTFFQGYFAGFQEHFAGFQEHFAGRVAEAVTLLP